MFKIFNQFRKTTIRENRFSKYLLYAIGEIVLVVIGILIALQINTSNEHRKERAMVETYTANLIEDLAKDSIQIIKTLSYIKQDSAALSSFAHRASKSTAPFDTIVKIARYEYAFLIGVHLDYNDDTYNVLTSTGHIGFFEKDLVAELYALHNLQDMALEAAVKTLDSYRDILLAYGQKYPIAYKSSLIENGTLASDLVWEQISPKAHATVFNGIVLAKSDSYRLSLRYLPLVQEKINELLATLREQ
jgi:hypothetical protein